MRGRNDSNRERGDLFNGSGYHFTVFGDDVGEIAKGLGEIVFDIGTGVVKDIIPKRPVSTESVSREENAVFSIERHHGLGPVHHRGGDEPQGSGSQRDLVTVGIRA